MIKIRNLIFIIIFTISYKVQKFYNNGFGRYESNQQNIGILKLDRLILIY